ncbi:MAG: hypothetical protein WBL83_12370, partial [Buttiauxella sp.]
ISLVKGSHSLEVKGDLAQKVAGALGVDAQGDIVLQSNSKITLKMGGSFIVIHPGGVDITGLKINLNGGGSPGTPVQTLQAAVLSHLSDKDDSADEPPEDEDGSGNSGEDSGGNGAEKTKSSESEPKPQSLRFALSEDAINKLYVIRNSIGNIVSQGSIGDDGRTPRIKSNEPDEFSLALGEVGWNVLHINVTDSPQGNIAEDILFAETLYADPYIDKIDMDDGNFLPSELIAKIVGDIGNDE